MCRVFIMFAVVIVASNVAMPLAQCSDIVNGFLLETAWGQRGYFTRFSPGNKRLGCWSTAVAQVLYYHRLVPSGDVIYTCSNDSTVSVDYDEYPFDCSLFVNGLDRDTPEESRHEVARYVYYASSVIQKDYDTSTYVLGHSARANAVAQYYGCYTHLYSACSRDTLKKIISWEIDARRPVMFHMTNMARSKYHAVVIDGYRIDGAKYSVHVNMGWEGKKDGWYDIDRPILSYDDMCYGKIMTIESIAGSCRVFAPRPMGVEAVNAGSWQDGAHLTIYGCGFGQKDPATPYLWDTLENQSGYAGLEDGSIIPRKGIECDSCPWSAGHGDAVYYNTSGPGVRVQGRPNYEVYKKGYMSGLEIDNTGDNPIVYVNYWTMATRNMHDQGHGTVENKLLRIWSSPAGDGGRTSWQIDKVLGTTSTNGSAMDVSVLGYMRNRGFLVDGQWSNIEATIYSKDISSAGGGRLTLSVDNARVLETSSELASAMGPYDYVCRIGSDPNDPSKYDNDTYIYFGDIYIDNCIARVLVGNASTFSECTHTEIQIPVMWGRCLIEVELNLGSFSSGEHMWLYVINSGDKHNESGCSMDLLIIDGEPGD